MRQTEIRISQNETDEKHSTEMSIYENGEVKEKLTYELFKGNNSQRNLSEVLKEFVHKKEKETLHGNLQK